VNWDTIRAKEQQEVENELKRGTPYRQTIRFGSSASSGGGSAAAARAGGMTSGPAPLLRTGSTRSNAGSAAVLTQSSSQGQQLNHPVRAAQQQQQQRRGVTFGVPTTAVFHADEHEDQGSGSGDDLNQHVQYQNEAGIDGEGDLEDLDLSPESRRRLGGPSQSSRAGSGGVRSPVLDEDADGFVHVQ